MHGRFGFARGLLKMGLDNENWEGREGCKMIWLGPRRKHASFPHGMCFPFLFCLLPPPSFLEWEAQGVFLNLYESLVLCLVAPDPPCTAYPATSYRIRLRLRQVYISTYLHITSTYLALWHAYVCTG